MHIWRTFSLKMKVLFSLRRKRKLQWTFCKKSFLRFSYNYDIYWVTRTLPAIPFIKKIRFFPPRINLYSGIRKLLADMYVKAMIHPQSLLPSQAAIICGVGASSQCYYWDELMLLKYELMLLMCELMLLKFKLMLLECQINTKLL